LHNIRGVAAVRRGIIPSLVAAVRERDHTPSVVKVLLI